MCGIAEVLHNMGFVVSGSDIAKNDNVKRLQKLGLIIYLGHKTENVKYAETLVYSSAIVPDNQEIKEAFEKKIPVISRAEMLAELMRLKFSIAVAGTHGKTTTTSMIACVLGVAQKDPTYVVGGRLKTEETGAKLGKSDYLVAEADESDGSFLKLFPTIAVITNIEDDHLDYYKNMSTLRGAFLDFANKVPFYGLVVLNVDCDDCQLILPDLNKRVLTYGFSESAEVKAENIMSSAFHASFNVKINGKQMGQIEFKVGGNHNISNALGAISVLSEIGIPFETIQEGFKRFSLPERRLQILFIDDNHVIVDDYAHHPTEIKATIDTLQSGNFNRIIAVFQPHRFTRVEILMDKFAASFAGINHLILARIYSANQDKIKNVDSGVLFEKIKKAGTEQVIYIEEFEDIFDYLKKEMRKGDAVVFFSAGDLTILAHQFADFCRQEKNE